MPCKKCGEAGHYTKTCPKGKKSAKEVAAPAAAESGSVAEQLRARRVRIQKELEVIDRILPELEALDLA